MFFFINILLLIVAMVVAAIILRLTEKITGSDDLAVFFFWSTFFVFWAAGTDLFTHIDDGIAAFLGMCFFEMMFGSYMFSIPEGVEIILLNGYDVNGVGANSYKPLF